MAAHPLWKGHISFGLVNIPVSLYPAVGREKVIFHLLDSRNMARVRYERVNEETGEEVPWAKIVRAYEYEKGNYIVIEEKELKKAVPTTTKIIEIENFVPRKEVDCIYFEKPYYVVPDKNGEKGYLILREVLKKTDTLGISKVVIRSKQYLAALFSYKTGLLVNLLRFSEEISKLESVIPYKNLKQFKITTKELLIAEQLVKAMLSKWEPIKYHDEFREKISKWVKTKIKTGKTVSLEKEPPVSSNVVDFIELLKKSIKEKGKKQPLSKKKLSRKNYASNR